MKASIQIMGDNAEDLLQLLDEAKRHIRKHVRQQRGKKVTFSDVDHIKPFRFETIGCWDGIRGYVSNGTI